MSSPTARSLALLRKEGWTVGIVERRLPFTRRTVDFLNYADLVAVHPDGRTLAVQATSGANVAARLKKVQECPAVPVCLAAKWAIEVWGWSKRGPRGGRKLWTVDRRPVMAEDLAPVEAPASPIEGATT